MFRNSSRSLVYITLLLFCFWGCSNKGYDDYLRSACKKSAQSDYAGALSDFNNAILLDSKRKDAYYERGVMYSKMGDHKDAVKDYSVALGFASLDAKIYSLRAYEYVQLGENFKAIADYTQVIAKAKDKNLAYNALLGRGKAYQYSEIWQKALSDYNAAIKIYPEKGKAYFCRSFVWAFYKKRYDKAINDLNKSIYYDPSKAEYYFWRGYAFAVMQNKISAFKDFDRAIKIDGSKARYYLHRAKVMDDERLQLLDLQTALKIDPDYIEALELRGITYLINEDYENAIKDYDRLTALKPDNEEYARYFAEAKYESGDYIGAIEGYSRLVLMSPRNPLYYYFRAKSYLSIKDFVGAEDDINYLITHDDDGAKYGYYLRGFSKGMRYDYIGAKQDIQKSASLGFKDAIEFLNMHKNDIPVNNIE